jgi:hypothetical protein
MGDGRFRARPEMAARPEGHANVYKHVVFQIAICRLRFFLRRARQSKHLARAMGGFLAGGHAHLAGPARRTADDGVQ